MFDWLLGQSIKRGIDAGIKEGVDQAMDNFAKTRLPGIVDKILAEPEYKWFWFCKHMQARMLEVDPNMDRKEAFDVAVNAYKELLKDEKIEFGDLRYDWSRAGARDVIQSYEIDHWESR